MEENEMINLTGKVENFLSSYKVETLAIVLVLLVIGKNQEVNIYTDSKSVIDHYDYLKENNFELHTRDFFKQESIQWGWGIIMELIKQKNLKI